MPLDSTCTRCILQVLAPLDPEAVREPRVPLDSAMRPPWGRRSAPTGLEGGDGREAEGEAQGSVPRKSCVEWERPSSCGGARAGGGSA